MGKEGIDRRQRAPNVVPHHTVSLDGQVRHVALSQTSPGPGPAGYAAPSLKLTRPSSLEFSMQSAKCVSHSVLVSLRSPHFPPPHPLLPPRTRVCTATTMHPLPIRLVPVDANRCIQNRRCPPFPCMASLKPITARLGLARTRSTPQLCRRSESKRFRAPLLRLALPLVCEGRCQARLMPMSRWVLAPTRRTRTSRRPIFLEVAAE